MATYREIHGKAIKSLSTDPSAPTDAGQIWYNTASDTFKSILNVEAWASAASMGTARDASNGGGTQTAAIVFGGLVGPGSPNNSALTEEYNGSGFAAGGALNTARYDLGGTGLQTAALAIGGTDGPGDLSEVEEYNGSAWSEETNIPGGRKQQAVFGTQTAAVMTAGSPALTTSFKYDGSSWTSTGALSTGRSAAAKGSGTQTAGLCVGGQVPAVTNATEEFDGSSWTAGGNLNSARKYAYGGGIQTSSLIAGGNTGSRVTSTELYNGSSWTTSSNLGTAIESGGSAVNSPSNTAGLTMGGYATAVSALTEEFNSSATAVTGAAWAAGTNWPGSNMTFAGMGTGIAYVKAAGNSGSPGPNPVGNDTYEYDGSSWTGAPTVPYSSRDPGGAGTQTAGIIFGGQGSPAALSTAATYDGSSWTGAPSMSNARRSVSGTGLQTTTIVPGGAGPASGSPEGVMDETESFNGSSWSAEEDMPAARASGGSLGVESAALRWGGISPGPGGPEAGVFTSLEYDGSSWTAGGTLNTARNRNDSGGAGTLTAGLIYGGGNPGNIANAETYNGTSFTTSASLGTAGGYRGSNASPATTNVLAVGGGSNNTEAFTPETTALNVKTLTQS